MSQANIVNKIKFVLKSKDRNRWAISELVNTKKRVELTRIRTYNNIFNKINVRVIRGSSETYTKLWTLPTDIITHVFNSYRIAQVTFSCFVLQIKSQLDSLIMTHSIYGEYI